MLTLARYARDEVSFPAEKLTVGELEHFAESSVQKNEPFLTGDVSAIFSATLDVILSLVNTRRPVKSRTYIPLEFRA